MLNGQKVRKIVIPAAGYGTRFLPVTKASPKEMLPIVDKPVIQYIVEEAVAAGIEEIILITGSNKRALEDHFDYNFELEEVLKRANKMEQYHEIRAISDMARFVYVRQKEQLGNGHAVLQAKELIGNEPFAVAWGDEIFPANPPRMKQLVDAYHEYHSTILTTYSSQDPTAPDKYAIVSGERIANNITKVGKIEEKPGAKAVSPYLVSIGGYVFPPQMLTYLENVKPGKGGEIWLIDAINLMMQSEAVYALDVQNGHHYDCGNKFDYLRANIDFGMQRADIAPQLKKYLATISKDQHDK
jgi:UTP--glucose-1-phosphate uridylyltransferase